MKKARFTNGVQGKGFAAALVLSICAVGISTYAAYSGALGTKKTEKETKTTGYEDNVFVFTEKAETVNAEKFDIPKETPAETTSPADTTAPASENAMADEAGLFFKSPKTMPVANAKVINPFSNGELVKSETLGVWKTHDGVDLAAPLGTAVSAIMKGTVTEVTNDPLWGICVAIDHGSDIVAHYCGLSESVSVKVGQEVAMGEVIAQVGNSADIECKLEPHLHLAVKIGGAWTDPITFIEGKN